MANDINSVTIIGRTTREVELKQTQSGTSICTFSIANNKSYTKDGNKVENTGFYDCTAFGKTADLIHKYVKKGDKIAVLGSLNFSSWEKDGKNMSKVNINVAI